MRLLARGLEAAGLALALLALGILPTGGWTVGGVILTRVEDVVVALAVVAGVRLAVAPIARPAVAPLRLVVGAVVLYVALMGFIVMTRHFAFRTHALDLGYYVQVVWSIAAGRGALVTLPPMHAWGDHFSPVLYLLAPLAWVAPVAPALLLAQTAIFAAGALAVFGAARRALGDPRPAAAFAVLYLVNPSLHGINIRDVHPAAFAIPLVIAAALAFDARRYGWCAAALASTLAGREDAAVAVVGFGIWLALARRRWALGAGVIVACLLLLWIDIRWVMPYFRGEPYPHLHRYARFGASLPEILATLLVRPWRWLEILVTVKKLVYLGAMLAPLGFLPLLGPRALAAALPALAMNLLAVDPVLFHHRSQYQSFILPFLLLAAIEGYAWLARAGAPLGTAGGGRGAGATLASGAEAPRPPPAVAASRLLLLAFVASVILTSRTLNDLMVTKWRHGPEERALAALLARVPARVPVSVNERVVPHISERPEVFVFPFGVERSEYVLERGEVITAPPAGWLLVRREGGWVLLRRGARAV